MAELYTIISVQLSDEETVVGRRCGRPWESKRATSSLPEFHGWDRWKSEGTRAILGKKPRVRKGQLIFNVMAPSEKFPIRMRNCFCNFAFPFEFGRCEKTQFVFTLRLRKGMKIPADECVDEYYVSTSVWPACKPDNSTGCPGICETDTVSRNFEGDKFCSVCFMISMGEVNLKPFKVRCSLPLFRKEF